MGISDKCCTTPDIPLLSKVFVKPSKPLIAVGCLILKDECGPIDCITMFWVWVTDLYMTPTLFNNISNTVADQGCVYHAGVRFSDWEVSNIFTYQAKWSESMTLKALLKCCKKSIAQLMGFSCQDMYFGSWWFQCEKILGCNFQSLESYEVIFWIPVGW